MSIGYTKVELISEEAFRRKMEGETNREIGERYGLTREQVHNLVSRQNRKQRLMAAGYVPCPKSPPHKGPVSEDIWRGSNAKGFEPRPSFGP